MLIWKENSSNAVCPGYLTNAWKFRLAAVLLLKAWITMSTSVCHLAAISSFQSSIYLFIFAFQGILHVLVHFKKKISIVAYYRRGSPVPWKICQNITDSFTAVYKLVLATPDVFVSWNFWHFSLLFSSSKILFMNLCHSIPSITQQQYALLSRTLLNSLILLLPHAHESPPPWKLILKSSEDFSLSSYAIIINFLHFTFSCCYYRRASLDLSSKILFTGCVHKQGPRWHYLFSHQLLSYFQSFLDFLRSDSVICMWQSFAPLRTVYRFIPIMTLFP